MTYTEDLADSQEAVCDALTFQANELDEQAEPESDMAVLVAEALALLAQAQSYLTSARAAAALGNDAQANQLLKDSIAKSTAAANKLLEALGE